MGCWKLASILGLTTATLTAAADAAVLYVDDDGAPGGTGLTWLSPMPHLQDALTAAASSGGAITEIRVAAGLYRPDRDLAHPSGSGDREAAFHLLDGVALLGGYAGTGAPNPGARNIDAYPTVLSGDLLDNDHPQGFFNHDDNAYHVVVASATDASAVIDGFTIRSGYSNTGSLFGSASGGGVHIDGGSPTIRHCTFTENHVYGMGGGIFNFNGAAPLIEACTFIDNTGSGGGGIGNLNGSPLIVGCLFMNNSTTGAYAAGGAIYNFFSSSSPEIRQCTFIENIASNGGAIGNTMANSATVESCMFIANEGYVNGGAVYCSEGADPTLVNCTLVGNSAVQKGGAIMNAEGNTTVVINCTITGNSAGSSGGGIQTNGSGSHPWVANTILWGNIPDQVVDFNDGAATTIERSAIQGGWWGEGSGNISANPKFVSNASGDFHLAPGSPCIDAGDPAALPPGITTDLDGKPRLVDDPASPNAPGVVDMGAYEYQAGQDPGGACSADVSGDGFVDMVDLIEVIIDWGPCPGCDGDINGDGKVDAGDLTAVILQWGKCG